MIIETERFGQIELQECRIIEFAHGLPGLEELHKYIILEVTESKPLYWLQSIESKHICLPVIIPFEFMEDYFIEIRDCEMEELKLEGKDDLLIMNVVVIPEDIRQMTANMAAPIVVNAKQGMGKQFIIDAKDLPIRLPIYDMIMNKLKKEGVQADAGIVEKEG